MIAQFLRAFAIAALLALAGLATLYTLDRYRAPGSEPLLPASFPASTAPYLKQIDARLAETDERTDAQLIEIAGEMLRHAPLAAEPLILAADEALHAGDRDRAVAAIETAIIRNPRNPRLQAWLADDAAARGDLAAAIVKLETLLRLDGANRASYIDAMARIAAAPGGPSLIEAALEAEPDWSRQLVVALNRSHPDIDFLIRINRYAPEAHGVLIQRLVRESGPRIAYEAWRTLLGEAAPTGTQFPYDPEFAGLLGAAPFNWRLNDKFAELNASGGLYVSYDGRGRVLLVDQMVLAPPGNYRLEVEAVTQARTRGGRLIVTITCPDTLMELGALELADTGNMSRTTELVVDVPDTQCEVQQLRITGEPAEFTHWIRSEVSRIDLIPIPVAPAGDTQ